MHDAQLGKADALLALEQFDRALEAYSKCRSPGHAAAVAHGRGKALGGVGRLEDAVKEFESALALDRQNAMLWSDYGRVLQHLGRLELALESFNRSASLAPQQPEPHLSRARVLQQMQRPDLAVAAFDRTIELAPDIVEPYFERGVALASLGQFERAAENFARVARLDGRHDRAFAQLGFTLVFLTRYREAMEAFDKALALNPNSELVLGAKIHLQRQLCDWRDIESLSDSLLAQMDRGQAIVAPYTALTVLDTTPEQQLRSAETYATRRWTGRRQAPVPSAAGRRRLKLGYFSADFYTHATTSLMAELVERHDREVFDVIGFNLAEAPSDETHDRMRRGFDQFIDGARLGHDALANLARAEGIDIAIDLKGYTVGARTDVFAHRAAPIQVNFLGYPGTMGAPFMDYIVADRVLINDDERAFYKEKVVRLPHSYQPIDTSRSVNDVSASRAYFGLPENAFVFCSFNNAFKLTPAVFDCWVRILLGVEGSVLWLLGDNDLMMENLRREAAARGIGDRIVFAERLPMAEHLGRQRLADLFLDCVPCNAHTTASDALLAGLPVLTIKGRSFPGRVAASVLTAAGLPDLITANFDEYQSLALKLAREPEAMAKLKARVSAARTSPLFDMPSYTRGLEAAYQAMWARQQSALAPEHIDIDIA